MKRVFFLVLLTLFFVPSVSAVIFHSTSANQDVFRNGDLVIISVETNTQDLVVTADFRAVDSGFDSRMVLVETMGSLYEVVYPITFGNTRGDGSKVVLLNFYDPSSGASSSISYNLQLNNFGPRLVDGGEVVIRVLDERELFRVEEGFIQVCDPSGCNVYTEAEYDDARNILISSGQVSLSNLTYNQLKDEISDAANRRIRDELSVYLSELAMLRNLQENAILDLRSLYDDQYNLSLQAEARSSRMLRNSTIVSVFSVLLVLFVVGSLAYFIYLRTTTTWIER